MALSDCPNCWETPCGCVDRRCVQCENKEQEILALEREIRVLERDLQELEEERSRPQYPRDSIDI